MTLHTMQVPPLFISMLIRSERLHGDETIRIIAYMQRSQFGELAIR